jgi:hypothetical protein
VAASTTVAEPGSFNTLSELPMTSTRGNSRSVVASAIAWVDRDNKTQTAAAMGAMSRQMRLSALEWVGVAPAKYG